MIIYNQALNEKIEYVLEMLKIKGFTKWHDVMGAGTNTGEPRMGTHTWPEMNSSVLTIIPDEMVNTLIDKVNKIDDINNEVGIRAFVWNIEKTN